MASIETLAVKTTMVEEVSVPIAQQLCADFADWLDRQGFTIDTKPGRAIDDRDHEELARDFLKEYR